jgi:hypothetical protein
MARPKLVRIRFDKGGKVNVKLIVQAAQMTDEEWEAATKFRKVAAKSSAPKPRKKYAPRKAKVATTEPKPKREAKGNGGDLDLKFPKPGAKKRGRPRKVQTMVPPPEATVEAEA